MLAVKKIVFDHDLTLIGPYTSLGGVFQGPLYYYLLAPFLLLTKGNPIGPMHAMLFISIATIIVAYALSYRLFGKTPALFISFFFAISPEAAAAATYIWNPHPMWLLIASYLFILFIATHKKPAYHWCLWPLIFIMFHFEMAFGVVLFLATLLYVLAFARKSLTKKYVTIGAVLSCITVLPQILFEFRNNFLMTRSVMAVLSGSGDRGLFVQNEFSGYIPLMQSHINAFISNFKSAFPDSGSYHFLPQAVLLVLIGVILFFRRRMRKTERRFIAMLLSLVLIVLMLNFLFPFPIRYWFLTGFQSFYLVLAGIAFAILSRIRYARIFAGIVVIFCCMYVFGRLTTLYSLPASEGGTAKIQGKLAALDAIYADSPDSKFGVLIFTPPVLTDAYDYLIWWRAKTTYHYIPYQEKRGTVYLLIEPDPDKPWSYNGWLETVIVKGNILRTTTLPSGFIIQKRFFP